MSNYLEEVDFLFEEHKQKVLDDVANCFPDDYDEERVAIVSVSYEDDELVDYICVLLSIENFTYQLDSTNRFTRDYYLAKEAAMQVAGQVLKDDSIDCYIEVLFSQCQPLSIYQLAELNYGDFWWDEEDNLRWGDYGNWKDARREYRKLMQDFIDW